MNRNPENLHCGACMIDFETVEELNRHLEDCPAAFYLLPLMYQVWGGNDKVGHPLAHFIQCCHREAHLIKRYAYSVADEMNTFDRSKIHSELCSKLEIDYNSFRPFESSDIIEMPDRKEAERILWAALFNHANKLLDLTPKNRRKST